MHAQADETPQERVVFSALYNESDGYLTTYVENFLRHTDANALLVVNLPPGRRVACSIADASGRVLIFSGVAPRQKYGHTLLNGHLEAFDAALAHLGSFGYFCSLASNALFVRRFDQAATLMALERTDHVASLDLDDLPNGWWWSSLQNSPEMVPYMKATWGLTTAIGNQIEGLFATATDWGLLYQRRAQIIALGEKMMPESGLPLEEILPGTIICAFGSHRFVNLCHMFWDRPMNDSVKLDDVLGMADHFPAHVCLLKWFQRSPTNLITAAAAKGLIGDMTASLATLAGAARNHQRVLYRMIFEELVRILRPAEGFLPLMSTWRSDPDGEEQSPPRFDFERTLTMHRELILMPVGPDGPLGRNAAYIFTEQTGDQLNLRFTLDDSEQTVVSLSSALVDAGERDETIVQGFLYLACRIGPGDRIFRLRVFYDDGNPSIHLTDRIVLARGGHHDQQLPVPIVEHDGAREFYYSSEASRGHDDVWIGLPFFGRSNFSVAIDVV